jgi:hypothetical protein
MEPVNKLPGLTFYVDASSLKDGHGSVQLSATVKDFDLWDQVIKKLDNFRVYTVSDLSTAVMEVLQEESKEEKEAHAREVAGLRERLERAEAALSHYQLKEKEELRLAAELKKLELHGIKVE